MRKSMAPRGNSSRSHGLRLLPPMITLLVTAAAFGGDAATSTETKPTYAYATNGVLEDIHGIMGSKTKILLSEANLGGKELEAIETTLQPGTTVGRHTHTSLEIIYVLSGTYEHEVNGKMYLLRPGMVGIVRPGDRVRHLVPKGTEAAKLLIIWAPAGEAAHAFRHPKGVTPDPVPEVHAGDQ